MLKMSKECRLLVICQKLISRPRLPLSVLIKLIFFSKSAFLLGTR